MVVRLKEIRNLFAVGLSNMGTLIVGLISIRVLTEVLPVPVYGELGLLLGLFFFFQQIVFGPINSGILRFYSFYSSKDDGTQVVTSLLLWVFKFFIGFAFLLLLIGAFLYTYIGFFSVISFVFFILLAAVSGSLNSCIFGDGRHKTLAFFQFFSPFVRLCFAVFFVFIFGTRIEVVLFGYAFGAFITICFQSYISGLSIFGRNREFDSVSCAFRADILRYAKGPMLWGLFSACFLISDRVFLAKFGEVEDLAVYLVLFQLGYVPTSQVFNIFTQLVTPRFFALSGKGGDLEVRFGLVCKAQNFIYFGVVLTFIVVLLSHIYSTDIIDLFVADKYVIRDWMFPIMVLSGSLFGVSQVGALAALSGNVFTRFAAFKIVASVSGILGMLLGIMNYGMTGAIIAQLCHSLIFLLLVCIDLVLQRTEFRPVV